jgi:hypothetical protein
MAAHNVNDLAIAGIALQVALLKHLEATGVIKNGDAGTILQSAINSTSPEHRAAVTAIMTDMING